MKYRAAAVLFSGPGRLGAILPETIGPYHRASVSQPALADRAVWDEYGLKDSEAAVTKTALKNSPSRSTTYRTPPPPWPRSTGSGLRRPSTAAKLAAETPDSLLWSTAITCFFAGYKPSSEDSTRSPAAP